MKILFLIFILSGFVMTEVRLFGKKNLFRKQEKNSTRMLSLEPDRTFNVNFNQSSKINSKILNSRLLSVKNMSIENLCWTRPCLNGATCYGSFNHYFCHCSKGFVGFKCEINLGERKICGDGSCYGNGICIQNEQYVFRCECYNNFTGFYCNRHKLREFKKFSQ